MHTVNLQNDPLARVYMEIDKAAQMTPMETANPNLDNHRFDRIFIMACKFVNDTLGSDGLISSFPVYGNIPPTGVSLGEPHPSALTGLRDA